MSCLLQVELLSNELRLESVGKHPVDPVDPHRRGDPTTRPKKVHHRNHRNGEESYMSKSILFGN